MSIYHSWVKKLGQWHIYKSGSSHCLCGQSMLGNDYTRVIAIEDRVPCPNCVKEYLQGTLE